MKLKPVQKITYDELVEQASADILSELLTSGGKGLRSAVFKWLSTAITWKDIHGYKREVKCRR